MKLIQGAMILLLSSYAVGQASPTKDLPSSHSQTANVATQSGATAPKDKFKVAITADTPVVTVSNVCESSAKDCKTVLTRKQFESTLLGLSGGKPVPPDMPRRFASQYGEMLIFSGEAEKLGMEKDPEMEAAIHFARMQVLATRYLSALQEKSQPTMEEIQKYYDDNQALFQGVSLDRLMIPTAHAKSKKPEELKALADDMRKRLAAGEDASKLEDEIYSKLALQGPPATTVMVRQGDSAQESLTKLKAGEVSDVISDRMVLLVFKSQGPKTMSLDMVKDEIQSQLAQKKLRAAIDTVISDRKTVLNDAYFGPEPSNPHEQ